MVQSATTSPARRPDEPPLVIASGLTKLFKDFWLRDRARAVDGIDFEIHRGEIFGLLGPNGSGKSTTIKMILGLLKKSKGRLAVFGRSPHDVQIKSRIGYLPEESYLYPFLNARETIDYYGKLFGLDGRTREKRIDELLDMVGLTAVQHRQVREYSKGMQRRIGIAQALINDPEFLILDEPTTGLDPLGTRQVKDLILHLGKRGKTILLSSHLLADVEDCVDRMVILYGGKIRAAGTCDDLLEAKERTIIETEDLDERTLEEIRGVLSRHQRSVSRVSRPRQKLEDLFIDLVERARAEQVATSGAAGSGPTASFLMGENERGDALIERLTSGPSAGPAPDERPMPIEIAKGPKQDVIEDLLAAGARHASNKGEPASATPPTSSGPSSPSASRKPSEPDRSVIGNLLAPEGDGGKERSS